MTIDAGTTVRVSEVGNGVKVAFDFNFRIFAASDLDVFKVVTATGAQTSQVIVTDYTVTINGIDNALTTPGGTVTYTTAPLATETSLILADYVLDQGSDFPIASNLPEVAFEDGLDKLTLIAIQFEEELGRAAKLPEATTLTDLSLPLPTANKALIWNSTATALINSTDDFDDAATQAAASASAAATSASNAASSASAAATSASNAATSASEAQAAVGGVRVSADDTTANNLEAKLIAGDGLAATTQNPGGNETRTLDVDVNSLTDTAVTLSDEFLFGDVSDSNNIKKDTYQGLVDVFPSANDTTAGLIEVAVQSEMETGTSTTLAVTPGRQHFHVSAAKAWVSFDPTASILASYNVTSITDSGLGDFTVNYTTSFSSANYAALCTLEVTAGTTGDRAARIDGSATGSAGINVLDFSAGTLSEADMVSVGFVAYGDL